MSAVYLTNASRWLQVNTLPSLLVELHFADCELHHMPSGIANLTNLKVLDLYLNDVNSTIPTWLYSLGNLESLDLSFNVFHGEISSSLGNLTALVDLQLSGNELEGEIPNSLGNLCRLTSVGLRVNNFRGRVSEILESLSRCSFDQIDNLDFSSNNFSGHLSSMLGIFKNLSYLDLSYNSISGLIPVIDHNSFEGVVSEAHFTNLTRLKMFIAHDNSLTLKTNYDWFPPFQLFTLSLGSWRLDPSELPTWLQSQNQLFSLNMSNTRISANYVDLSSNQLSGEVPNIVSANWPKPKQDSNSSSMEIPDCLSYWPNLTTVNLEDNNLTGKIPSSIGDLLSLGSLHLRNNNLSGELPVSLQNCEWLILLDLAGNKFAGGIPIWFGPRLAVLSLRSNKFHGFIPDELCSLTNLQILDLAYNNLSGTIPRCFQNFSSMATTLSSEGGTSIEDAYYSYYMIHKAYIENADFVTKGREVKYNTVLRLVTSLDLSSNMISGEIPEELTSLIILQTLNLSNNLLTGRIPSKIGDMKMLESLDLSVNQLSGEISPSISNLTFLSYLNLSYNKLIGQIPISTQLQSFDQSSYVGNKLCGPPLKERCSVNEAMPPVGDDKHVEGYLLEDGGFYLSLGLGFAFGFWIVLGSLLSNVPWSNAFSQFQNRIVKKLYAAIVECY
ncbi:LRR receptor-like serine/threonine-protein kinase [Pyrus ussuriensis x Pyrus communis]|uniref:LRR receptor-like serine/threonine-protein kinase n=1 Tax=Pyrus ussuriensis x Pyrus communis TaxID=2448454 RepID=A0A5N5H024_9ROSA|nr:LRR receptor-like serine/threonine-protein kinase [Pyrus ussuriensis x Pyrus communis]